MTELRHALHGDSAGRQCWRGPHDCTQEIDLVIELSPMNSAQPLEGLDGDGEPLAGSLVCQTPPTTPSTSSTG